MRCALVIASDAIRGRDLALRMRERGFQPLVARDATGGVAEARLREPDIVLIDPPDDEPSGARTASAIRGVAPRANLFVVARANDDPGRLRVVPVNARASRRPTVAAVPAPTRHGERVVVGDLIIDSGEGRASFGSHDAGLTRKEFALLEELARNYGEVLTREQIHERVWGAPLREGSRSVDVLVRRLRQKVDERDGAFTFVQTVPGEGYRLHATVRALSA